MRYNTKVERQTYKIIELLWPALMRKRGRYETAWGRKTMEGVRAAIFSILVEIDRAYEEGR
jgi:hypothetical protein